MSQVQYYAEASTLESGLHLCYTGEEDCAPGHRYGGVRDHWLFHYVLDGEGRVRVGGKTTRLTRGGGFVFFPGQEHAYRASRQAPWRYVWIGFLGSMTDMSLGEAGITRDKPVFEAIYSPELAGLFRRAAEVLSHREKAASLAADGLLRLILAKLSQVLGTPDATPRFDGTAYVLAAQKFMADYFTRTICVADVARFIGLDREYLSVLFKAATGTTMKTFLTELRIERAKALLLNGRLAVAQVAASVGYREYAVFERAFKAATSMSPGEWRKTTIQ